MDEHPPTELAEGRISLQRQYVRCGKERCKKCATGQGHGPYWYAYWRAGPKVRKRYIGKELPRQLEAGDADHLDITHPNVAAFLEECGLVKRSPPPGTRAPKSQRTRMRNGNDAGTDPAGGKPLTPAGTFFDVLATIPARRTGILAWARAASTALSIPREQLAYRLALYRDQLAAHGVHLAQSTRYRALFVPHVGQDSGAYSSHIWKEATE
jgi:hypothetical protein